MGLGIGMGIGIGFDGIGGGSSIGFRPASLPGLVQWLDASIVYSDDAGTIPSTNTGVIAYFKDLSGNGNHATQTTNNLRPTWLAAGGPNSKPAVNFSNASFAQRFDVANGFSALTAGEVFLVVKSTDPAVSTSGSLWDYGSTAQGGWFPFTDTNTYEGWGTDTRKTLGVLGSGALNNFGIYNIISTSAEYTANYNGAEIFTTGTNTVGFTTTPQLGRNAEDSGSFLGQISELIIYSRKLSAAERTLVENYLSSKYAITLL